MTNASDLPSESVPARPIVRRRDRAWEVIHPLLLLTGAVIIGFLCVLFATGVDQTGAAEWVERFSTSPGAAGVAAVVAAGIGFWAIARQLRHNKSVERDAAWWKSFEWVTDRALPQDESDRLPYFIAIDMLAPLVDSASNATQERICGAFLDHLARLYDGSLAPELDEAAALEGAPDNTDTGTEGAADSPAAAAKRMRVLPNTLVSYLDEDRSRARSTLENYVKLTGTSPGRSFAVEAQLYSLRVVDAVSRVVKGEFLTLVSDRSADVIVVAGDGRRVQIATSGATTHLAAVSAALSIARATRGTTLVVTRGETEDPGTKVGERLFTARWRDERDDQELKLGIQRALEATPPESSADLSG